MALSGNKTSDLSDAELLKSEKLLKTAVVFIAVAALATLVIAIFVILKRGFNALFVLPFTMIPLLLVNLNALKQVRQERKVRNI